MNRARIVIVAAALKGNRKMSLSSFLSALKAAAAAAGVTPAQAVTLGTAAVTSLGSVPSSVSNALAVLPNAWGDVPRITALVTTIENAMPTLTAAQTMELRSLPTITSITDYNTAITQVSASLSSQTNVLTNALNNFGL